MQLNNIACRNQGEAWIVGDAGTVIYTNDGGDDWTPQTNPDDVGSACGRTQDDGPVYMVGNGSFLESDDTGATWRELGDGTTRSDPSRRQPMAARSSRSPMMAACGHTTVARSVARRS